MAIGLVLTIISSTTTAIAQKMGFSVWEVVNDNECRARITFLGAREFLFESGEQVATKSYKIKPFGKNGFHKFHMRTTSHNGESNCAGKIGAGLGDRQDSFILFNDTKTEMTFHGAPKPEASFNIVFRKVVVTPIEESIEEPNLETAKVETAEVETAEVETENTIETPADSTSE